MNFELIKSPLLKEILYSDEEWNYFSYLDQFFVLKNPIFGKFRKFRSFRKLLIDAF